MKFRVKVAAWRLSHAHVEVEAETVDMAAYSAVMKIKQGAAPLWLPASGNTPEKDVQAIQIIPLGDPRV